MVAVKVTLLNFMITQVDVSSTWASWRLLVLIHVFPKTFTRNHGFPMKYRVSGFNFALNQSIDWSSPHLGVPAMLQKKAYPGLQMGEVELYHPLKFASSIFQTQCPSHFPLAKIFGWWIWVEFSESVSLTWVPGVMLCVFLMHTSTILRPCRL